MNLTSRIVLTVVALGTFALGLAAISQQPDNIYKTVHNATFQIGQETVTGAATCSATAVGPHALLTASHCELPSDDLYLRGMDDSLPISKRLRDNMDHTIFLVSGYTFKTFVKIDQNDPLYQGEDVFYFGNPHGYKDFLRKGYIVGYLSEGGGLFEEEGPTHIIIDVNSFFGDSGAGVFNDKGDVIAVLSQLSQDKLNDVDFKITSAFELKFTPEQLVESAKP